MERNSEFCPDISIVTGTYNEEATIHSKIENMMEMTYPHSKVEWIIIDDCSKDQTPKIIEEFLPNSNIEMNVRFFQKEERKGLNDTLNRGYALATGDIVIKSDCDLVVAPDAVERLVECFQDGRIGAVTGNVKIANEMAVEKGFKGIENLLRMAESNLDSTYIFEPLSAFRRNLLEQIDERSIADDGEMALKIRKKGYRTIYCPKAVFYEETPTSFRERRRQKDRRAQGHIRLLLQQKGIAFRPKYGKFGLIIFPANFFMMVISPWWLLLILGVGTMILFDVLGFVALVLLPLSVMVYFVLYKIGGPFRFPAAFLDAQLSLLIATFRLVLMREKVVLYKTERE
ncbi:MAG: glycosyltransferase [Candidatus Heimdallarchaeota archaeon]